MYWKEVTLSSLPPERTTAPSPTLLASFCSRRCCCRLRPAVQALCCTRRDSTPRVCPTDSIPLAEHPRQVAWSHHDSDLASACSGSNQICSMCSLLGRAGGKWELVELTAVTFSQTEELREHSPCPPSDMSLLHFEFKTEDQNATAKQARLMIVGCRHCGFVPWKTKPLAARKKL